MSRTRKKTRAKDIYQTYTAHKPSSACTAVTPVGKAMVSSAAACSIWPMAHAWLCIVSGDDLTVFRFFVPDDLDFDIQTRPSEGPNTSSLWIWHKNIQTVPEMTYCVDRDIKELLTYSLADEKHGHWTPWTVGHTEKNCYYCNFAKWCQFSKSFHWRTQQ